ncbi:MAG: HAD family hydrolase, partial [Nitrospirota bacterium]
MNNSLAHFSWNNIDTVLLDMDGTLLDKYFDDYFWERFLPEQYAKKYNVATNEAKQQLLSRYKKEEKTLAWTDLDFWSKEFDLDIPALKEQVHHLIAVHPHVEDFLKFLRTKGKRIYLVTNAHYKTLDLKLRKTEIGKYFDSVVC